MEFDKLVLEVSAVKAGLSPITPPVLQGTSGVNHDFVLLFSDGNRYYAFDFYDRVTRIEVLKSFVKKFDTQSSVNIVCTGNEVTEGARTLALGYDMKIIAPESAESFFELQKAAPRRAFG